MRQLAVYAVAGLIVVAGLCFLPVQTTDAYPQFKKAFEKRYTGDKSTDVQKTLVKEVARAKCAVCHDPRPGKDGKVTKKNHNPYGETLSQYLTKKEQKDNEKTIAALEKVEGQKAEGAEKTYGDLLKEGKLPYLYEGFDYSAGKDDGKDDKEDKDEN